MSKLSDDIEAQAPEPVAPTVQNPYIKPKHRAIFERMKQGETITAAMIAMSYKPKTVNRPSVITKSKSWQALMDEQLPEDVVAMRHRELLDARKYRYETRGRGKNRREVRVDDGIDPIVMRAVELAYRLRKRMDDTPPTERPNVYNLFYQPNVQASVMQFEDTLKKTIIHELAGETTQDDEPVADASSDAIDADGARGADAGATEGASGRDGGEATDAKH